MTLATTILGVLGSPPPMRGKGTNAAQFNFCFGITPAYAGKSVFIDTFFQLF